MTTKCPCGGTNAIHFDHVKGEVYVVCQKCRRWTSGKDK